MNTILYFSPEGVVYETRAYSNADIVALVHDYGLESLTSADRQFDFWFTPSARPCRRKINRNATEMLLATTDFTAKTVPLLRGAVVVATHDAAGDLDGLSWKQLDKLSARAATLTRRDDKILDRRIKQESERLRKQASANVVTGRFVEQRLVAGG